METERVDMKATVGSLRHPVNVKITEALMNPPKASASSVSEYEKRFRWARSGCWRDCRACGPVGWMWAMVSQWGRHPVTLHWANPPDQSAVCQAGNRVSLHRPLAHILLPRSTRVEQRCAGVRNTAMAWFPPHIQNAKVNVQTPWVSCYFFFFWGEMKNGVWYRPVGEVQFRQSSDRVGRVESRVPEWFRSLLERRTEKTTKKRAKLLVERTGSKVILWRNFKMLRKKVEKQLEMELQLLLVLRRAEKNSCMTKNIETEINIYSVRILSAGSKKLYFAQQNLTGAHTQWSIKKEMILRRAGEKG